MNKNQAFLGKNLSVMKHLFLKIENKYSIKSRLDAEKLLHNQPDPHMQNVPFCTNFCAISLQNVILSKNWLTDWFFVCPKTGNCLTGLFRVQLKMKMV